MDDIISKRKISSEDYAHIKGWGVDLDPKNRPAYPMERTPPRLDGVPLREPEQQAEKVKILHSNERPGITPVFGTTLPPSGVSGKLREFAFKYSENDLRHWLVLLLADRINMFEGIADDLKRGRLPDLIAETGIKSEFKYNRAAAVKKTIAAASIIGIGVYLLMRNKRV
jgi:hypothetical protein